MNWAFVLNNSIFISSLFLYYYKSVSHLGGNDIALIRLPRVVRTIEIGGKHVLPICLPYNIEPEKRDILLGETLVVGWGKRGNFDRIKKHGAYSSKLNKIKVPMVDLETCRRKLFYQYNLWEDKHLCAGDEGMYTFSKNIW